MDIDFLAAIQSMAAKRPARAHLVRIPLGDSEPAWVGHEAERMLTLINEARTAASLPAINLEQVRSVEHRVAVHHMGDDYNRVYADRCAALATA